MRTAPSNYRLNTVLNRPELLPTNDHLEKVLSSCKRLGLVRGYTIGEAVAHITLSPQCRGNQRDSGNDQMTVGRRDALLLAYGLLGGYRFVLRGRVKS